MNKPLRISTARLKSLVPVSNGAVMHNNGYMRPLARLACRRKLLAPGQLHTFQLEDGRWIINFPTKDAWRQPSRLAYVTEGLLVLVNFVRLNAIESIAIPALGCGLGGLSWSAVRAKIVEAFSEIPSGYVDVKLFPPRGKW